MTIETNLVVTQARPIELAIDMIAAQSWGGGKGSQQSIQPEVMC